MLQAKLAEWRPYLFDEGEALTAGLDAAARGGAAEVFRGELDGREIAIKLGVSGGPSLFGEAEVLALATSRRMCALRGCGWAKSDGRRFVVAEASPEARPFIAMDWRESVPATKADLETALRIARDIGGALADAHAIGIAHGDVKRENVIMGAECRATLIDWGLACSVFQREPRGATLRYLATGDRDLGDARSRDMLALGVLIAEAFDGGLRTVDDPINMARRAKLPSPLDAICGALLTASPTARPDARWVELMAEDAIGKVSALELSDRRGQLVRASYLRTRRGALLGRAPAEAAPWLDPTTTWMQEIRILKNDCRISDTTALSSLSLLNRDEITSWLVTLVGHHAAGWPMGRIADAGEKLIAEGLVRLAEVAAPTAWTFLEVEEAVLGGPRRRVADLAPLNRSEGLARLSVELSEAPPKTSAIDAVERDPEAPPTLVMQAANALRVGGQLGRAQSLALRATASTAPGAESLVAEILRRTGDLDGARAQATDALDRDVDGRARAVLGRLAFDAGDNQEAIARVADEPGAACAEVAALAHAARGDLEKSLDALLRGEAYARSSEDRARLLGTRGYVMAAVDSQASLVAFRAATDHAVRAGLVVEEATYRTGDAAAAVDEGYMSEALAAGTRAALLWESLGRPGLAARAILATAAAHATLNAAPEAARAANIAARFARDANDSRAEAYAWLAIADSQVAGSSEGARGASLALQAIDKASGVSVDDRLHVMARVLEHTPDTISFVSLGELDRLADSPSGAASAKMGWWGARARQLLRADEAITSSVGALDRQLLAPGDRTNAVSDRILAALVALVSVPMPIWAKGPALHAGARLALARGRSDVAERLRPALRDAARTLMARVGHDLVAKAAEVDWVLSNLVSNSISMDAEQVRDLEHLVRALGTGERLGPLLRRVLDALVLWTGVERGLLLLRAPDGRLVPRAARNFARNDLHGEQAQLSQSLAHRALEALEPVIAVDAAGELPDVHRSVHALRLRSVLAVPLIARGEAVGVAYLDDRVRRGAFGPRELAWARTIAALASSMIADARDQVLLRRAVRTARRSNEKLAVSLADREAKLDAAERTIERTTTSRGRRYEEITGESEPMVSLLKMLDRIAASDVPVLVVGESGSGKELVARAIHSTGARANRPFVSENCGAIPEGLLESALFGHVRGAFTGADRPRVGLFEAADGGTLFLDEVGEMSLGMQTKLLRVLEDGMVRPLGTERPRRVSVRVITATHRDLEALVRERKFREDLYYRLNIISLRVPPLRERASDIPLLVKRLVDKHAGDRRVTVSRAALSRLSSFGWPGNVRQLENEIRRALVLADDVIDRQHLSPEIDVGLNGAVAEAGLNVRKRVDLLETTLVRDALDRTRGNQTQAAKLLGLSRFGLQKMMKRLEIELR